MTSYGQPPPPPPYDPTLAYAQPLKDRPTSVTVLAIIGIIWAIISILGAAYGLISSILMMSSGRTLFGPGRLNLPHSLVVVSIVQGVIGLALATTLLVSCIGALYLRRWAFRLVMTYAILTLLIATISTVLQVTWFGPETLSAMKQSQPNNPAFAQAQNIVQWAMVGGACIGWVFGCALPFCFLILWNKPQVKEAFEVQSS
jgi:hypothetical protein